METSKKDLWANILFPFAYFVLCTPGVLITFPKNSIATCEHIIPLPTKYEHVKGDGIGESELENVTSSTLTGPGMKSIYDARSRCMSYRSMYHTTTVQVLAHATLFIFACTLTRSILHRLK